MFDFHLRLLDPLFVTRPLRIEYAGAVYPVTSRGNERKAVFRSDQDRFTFPTCDRRTAEAVERYGYTQRAIARHPGTHQAKISLVLRTLESTETFTD